MRCHVLRLVLIAAPWFGATATAYAQWKLIVHGDGRELGPTPIRIPVAPGDLAGRHGFQGPSGERIASQGYTMGERGYLSLVLPGVSAQGEQVYRLSDGNARGGVSVKESGKQRPDVEVVLGGKPFTTLDLSTGPKPYLFPVIGPTGQPFTRAFPMQSLEGEDQDHPHQRSFWFTHGKVNGVDVWSEGTGHGRIIPRLVSAMSQPEGSAVVVVRTEDDWVDSQGKKVCEDERVITFYGIDSPRIVDFDITVKATNGPVTFGDTKEGMFGLRVASSMDAKRKPGGTITNAEGIQNAEAWGKASPWVDYSGPVAGKTVGIAILNHPESFRYPTTWHVRDYGLFAANPFGYHDFGRSEPGDHTIPAGESIRFRYRVLLHEGDTKTADIARAFESYARPPRVQLVKD